MSQRSTSEVGDDGELPRCRSASFVAVSGLVDGNHDNATFHAAFTSRKGDVDEDGVYADPVDGIYLRASPGNRDVETLVETAMDGTLIDPDAAYGGVGLPVTAMGIEEAGWAGGYLLKPSGFQSRHHHFLRH